MSYRLASGCSYTDPTYSGEDCIPIDWKVWPDHLNIDVNVARSGISNNVMIDKVYDEISRRGNPTSIHIMLTTWDRFSVYKQNIIPASYLKRPIKGLSDEKQAKFHRKQLTMEFILNHSTVDDILTDNLRKIYFLALYCISNKVRLTLAQGCHLWDYTINVNKHLIKVNENLFDRRGAYKALVSNEYFELMDKLVSNNSISAVGWPFVEALGGECYNDVRDPSSHISSTDGHPNADGQKHIAEWMS
jgi:hypothetical protein|tara:strand:+ start:1181 stop:1918 length:738 start_codon:yes stop_codon:yes gene_type:complete